MLLKIFDAHFHIIDKRFPLVSNDGYLPPQFTCDDYLKAVKRFKLIGGVVVSGSFHAFDHTYLLDAISRLGKGFVGVVNLKADVPNDYILFLHKSGVRGVRFNLYREGSESIEYLEMLAKRIYELVG